WWARCSTGSPQPLSMRSPSVPKTSMASTDPEQVLAIEVCYAHATGVWRRRVTLSVGARLVDALAASGFRTAFPDIEPAQAGVGVFGVKCSLDHVLHEGDRVEVYRPLVFDPKESRRRRAQHRAAAAA